MESPSEIRRFGAHKNAFGFLRLLFASLVIVSHTPEIAYGSRDQEPLTRLAGTISFGDLAVDGFFIISGYLIVGSFLKSPHFGRYLAKRVGRIYPGFLVAAAFCIFLVAPLGGASAAQLAAGLGKSARLVLTLQSPDIAGVFPSTFYPVLNGAMWTIAYEFRCYILVAVLGAVHAYRHPWIIVMLSIAALLAFKAIPADQIDAMADRIPHVSLIMGRASITLRLTGLFLAGSAFYLYRERIRFNKVGVILATAMSVLCLFSGALAEIGVAMAGGYLIFAVAAFGARGLLSRVNNRNDISYGVYLYAWPIEKLIFLFLPALSVWAVGLLTFATACILGSLSWHYVEKPVLSLVGHRLSGTPNASRLSPR